MAKEKKAKKAANPEMVKAIISAVTAVLCVVAVVITSVSITGQICDANLEIAEKSAASAGSVSGSVSSDDNSSYVDDNTPVVDDSTATPDADAPADDSTAADDNAAATPDANAPADNSAASTGAPVGNDIAKIVAYYNTAANNTKAYKGTMKLNILQGTTSKITKSSLPNVAVEVANGLLPNDYPTKKTFTVKNGKGEGYNERKQENESKPLNDILPIDGSPKMSTLAPAGVKSAKCEKVANGYKVTLVLKQEVIHSLDDKPKHHFSCMDVLDITSDDIKPFTAKQFDITYPGATLTAVINDKNLLTEFDVNEPVLVDGVCSMAPIVNNAEIFIDASWKQNVKFAY